MSKIGVFPLQCLELLQGRYRTSAFADTLTEFVGEGFTLCFQLDDSVFELWRIGVSKVMKGEAIEKWEVKGKGKKHVISQNLGSGSQRNSPA